MSKSLQKILSRPPRERGLLLLLAAVALLALLWLSLQAARHYQLDARQQARRAQTELAGMQQQVAALEPLLARQQRQRSPGWQDEVLALAAEQELPLTVAGRDARQLLFSPGTTDLPRLSRWLQQLEQEYYVRAVRLQLENGPEGITLVQLVLQRHE
ncbi:type II secretion system protein GspM [Erwinia sp. Leaf53]|uniref:type II secretion system protein GspM n=1 Tax=Erwinia sp. Leaf53 TaxID=1736225 RepID=UPI0006FCA9FB|nr:type II secretion system protein GspM [Erwinia sp. Leaf53]KQN58118.1 hypothetical protein ASF13_04845 [Erwinia sp. Leaf53]